MTPAITTLDNGLRIVSEARPGLETLSVGLWVNAGARHEDAAKSGLAHCLEHMVFKGTEHRSARDIALDIERVGGHLNAFTTRDHTCFYARTLADDLPLALDLLADLALRPRFDAAELAREKNVILQEIGEAEDTPDDIIFDELQRVAFRGQPLGRSILGTPASVEALSADDLRAFMRAEYRPEALVLSAVGRLDHAELVDRVAAAFACLAPGQASSRQTARFTGGHWRSERDLEQVHMTLAFEGFGLHDHRYYSQQLFSMLLGGGMSSRLFQRLREEEALAYSVYSFVSSHADTGLLGIYAGTEPERLEQLLTLLWQELRRVPTDLGEEEIEIARAQLRAGLLMALESTTSRMEQLGRQMLVFDRVLPVAEITDRITSVGYADIQALAAHYAAPDRMASAVIGKDVSVSVDDGGQPL